VDKEPVSPPPQPFGTSLRADGGLDVERIGLERERWSDLYHGLLRQSWTRLVLGVTLVYFAANVAFALLYWIVPGSISGGRPGSLADAFYFSVQTFATIGYGVFSPSSGWAHFLVTLESLLGIIFSAMATGLVFAKFARPTARVLFARAIVVRTHDGVPTLCIRIANGRNAQLVEAAVRVRVSRVETSVEGERMRRFHDLKLIRDGNPIFALTWTLFHPIVPGSPLYGATPASLEAESAMFIVIVTGTDETTVQDVHARAVYFPGQVHWNYKYVDVIGRAEDGRVSVDYRKFHDVEPM
jgi:inward rectifier potassium channel